MCITSAYHYADVKDLAEEYRFSVESDAGISTGHGRPGRPEGAVKTVRLLSARL